MNLLRHTSRKNRYLAPLSRCSRRGGSITLEFVFLLPVLLSLMLLTVDFGRFAHTYIAVSNAARAGASIGSFNAATPASKPLWDAAIQQAVTDEFETNTWFDVGNLVVAAPVLIDEGNGLRRVQVDVTYPFQTLINWPYLPGYSDPVDLRHVVVMRLVR
jgi:Flp pilus assembly protein TadG